MIWRRLRGIIGTTISWAGAGALGGLAIGVVQVVWLLGVRDRPWSLAVRLGGSAIPFWALIGAVLGFVFAVGLPLAARRVTTLGALSTRRMAISGAISGVLVSLGLLGVVSGGALPPLLAFITYIGVGGLIGCGFATGMLRIAQRVPLIDGGARRILPPAV